MSFHEIQFPTDISYGSAGGPGFLTHIIELDSGSEERVSRWNTPRRRYDVAYGIKSNEQMAILLNFYLGRLGAAAGFRYKDFSDFTTAEDHVSAPADTDTELGIGDDAQVDFQLLKKYTSGPTTLNRNITKPVADTVVVSIDDVAQPTGWTVDITTGIITLAVAPAAAESVKAGCEFDVPVRFGVEADQALQLVRNAYQINSLPSIPLVEIRDELVNTEDFFYGGGQAFALTADRAITLGDGRALSITPDASGHKITLPNLASLTGGGPYFYMENTSGAFTFEVRDTDDTLVTTVAVSSTATLLISDDGAGNLTWLAI
jgi:uncharacterized protein (TIGR02217 family)